MNKFVTQKIGGNAIFFLNYCQTAKDSKSIHMHMLNVSIIEA